MEKGLITTEKYRQVYLTEKGLRLAELISGKHVIIKKFFIDVLAVAPDIADTDACAIEHVISSDSVSAMERFLEERDLK
jgi:Mn-dependent DtxR family transcriptional regulator